MDEKELFSLVNPPFKIEFAGREYLVRKASLEKGIMYQSKIKELAGDPALDLKIAAYCLYLVLKDVEPTITEEFVYLNSPAAIDAVKWLETLGFMSPQKKLETQKGVVQ